MAEHSLDISRSQASYARNSNYYSCWSAETGSVTSLTAGQAHAVNGDYYIYRAYLKIGLGDIEQSWSISAAILNLYLTNTYCQSDDLEEYKIMIVEAPFDENSGPGIYSRFGSESFGSLTITDSMAEDTYTITLNSAGLQYLNDALIAGKEYIYLGLRSDQDIDAVAPDKGNEDSAYDYVRIDYEESSLEVTTTVWPYYIYPEVPVKPGTGIMAVEIYAIIKEYIELLTQSISEVVTGDNIALDADAMIELAQSSVLYAPEEIVKNSVATGAEFSSLSSDSTITTCTDMDIEALTNTTLTISGNAAVTGDLNISSTGYASVKEQIEHDNLWWEATGDTPSVDATKAKIYQELSTGDLKITINSGGSTKTAILADFSGL